MNCALVNQISQHQHIKELIEEEMQGIFVQLSEFYYKHNDVDDGYIFTKIHQ
jgi:hypothetical protein